ncbi:MAG: hypothetical protein PHQ23_13345, partial [Candidatus Wallbacteria bacterium]|nr:hypothetical protein [Candidatus Wallbacteria bacterium]
FLTEYKADNRQTWKYSVKHLTYIKFRSSSHKVSYVKNFDKLSISPELKFVHKDEYDGTYNNANIEMKYDFNRDSYFSMTYDTNYAKKNDSYVDTRIYRFTFKTSF